MKSEVKNLNERVEKLSDKLSEDERKRRQVAFAAHWNSLTEEERHLILAVFNEFEGLRQTGIITSDADLQKCKFAI